MQFLPSTWRRYGVDASSSGVRDPYNAADAIFAAARYLAAAGAGHDLPGAIYAYNHSWRYVRSVLLRAQVLSGEPTSMIEALSELGEGYFPIQLSYHASYGAQPKGAGGTGRSDRRAPVRRGAVPGRGRRPGRRCGPPRRAHHDLREDERRGRRRAGRDDRRDRPQPPARPLRAAAQRVRRRVHVRPAVVRVGLVPGAEERARPAERRGPQPSPPARDRAAPPRAPAARARTARPRPRCSPPRRPLSARPSRPPRRRPRS